VTLPDPQNHDDDGDRRPRRVVIWLVVAGIVLTGALVFLMDQYPGFNAFMPYIRSRG